MSQLGAEHVARDPIEDRGVSIPILVNEPAGPDIAKVNANIARLASQFLFW